MFVFRTERVLSSLERVADITTLPTDRFERARFLGPATTALEFDHRTRPTLEAIERGLGSQASLIAELKRKAPAAGARFERSFPMGRDHLVEEMAETGIRQRTTLREILLEGRNPALYPEELSSLAGAFLVFRDGGSATILRDDGAFFDHIPFTLPLIEQVEGGHFVEIFDAVPERWGDLDSFYRSLHKRLAAAGPGKLQCDYGDPKNRAVLVIDQAQQSIRSSFSYHQEEGYHVGEIAVFYESETERRQRGVSLTIPKGADFILSSQWEVEDRDHPSYPQIDSAVPQIYLHPGSAWVVKVDYPWEQQFPDPPELYSQIVTAVRCLKIGTKPIFNGVGRLQVREQTGSRGESWQVTLWEGERQKIFQVQFDAVNEEGIPLAWRLHGIDPKIRIDVIEVRDFEKTLRYLVGKNQASVHFSHWQRGPVHPTEVM